MSQPTLLPDQAGTSETQWIAESMQLVNWGGFHGHTLIELDPDATLLSGASGTGKSTILDGYLALMMPSDTPFNGASNDAAGRARNPEQRNLLSYLRGKTDDSRETGTGALTDKVLRGVDGPTWGAISMTFTNGTGRRLTVLRAFHVPRGAAAFKDITMKMATLDGRLDLRELEPLAAGKFDKRALTTRWPSMFVANTYTEFAQRLFDRLGIGAGGNGARALRLLARIQAGQQVRTVDGLYKAMVLEQPATYAAADSAANHFKDLDRSYQEMQAAADKQHTLARLPCLWDEREQARGDEMLIDTFGAGRPGDTPFRLWQLRTREELLESAARAALDCQRPAVRALAACLVQYRQHVARVDLRLGPPGHQPETVRLRSLRRTPAAAFGRCRPGEVILPGDVHDRRRLTGCCPRHGRPGPGAGHNLPGLISWQPRNPFAEFAKGGNLAPRPGDRPPSLRKRCQDLFRALAAVQRGAQ